MDLCNPTDMPEVVFFPRGRRRAGFSGLNAWTRLQKTRAGGGGLPQRTGETRKRRSGYRKGVEVYRMTKRDPFRWIPGRGPFRRPAGGRSGGRRC